MRNPEKSFPTESPMFSEINPEPVPESLTALGGARCKRFDARDYMGA
jgi:hypothetical protein